MGKSGRSRTASPAVVADHDIARDEVDEDEEILEDEAFNSDDERKYGNFFKGGDNADDTDLDDDDTEVDSSGNELDDDQQLDSEETDDGESAEGDGGQYMLSLLDALDDSQTSTSRDVGMGPRPSLVARHVKETEFSSTVVPQASLTMDSLMEGLQDTRGFGVLQQALKKVARGHSTAAPSSRVVSDRAQRRVHYEFHSKDVSQWLDVVQQNRQAETLDFRPKERLEVTRDQLVDKFVPTTEFEKMIHAALEAAGKEDEKALLKAEEAALQDDLGANTISLEEYKRRRGQLAKMRALMFYHEQKRHYINKIKSKKYRRIRKKQKQRDMEADIDAQLPGNPDLERELQEKEEVERMKERMTLAHKNTSKWAKRVLKRGKNIDADTRRALSAQLKRGDDLLKRMNSTRDGPSSDEDSDQEDLVETARKALADAENDSTIPIAGSGLFKMPFMLKGIEKQRERAREEARQLLLELEADEGGSEGADDGEQAAGDPTEKSMKTKKIASKREMKNILPDGELVASIRRFGNSTVTAMSGGIDIEVNSSRGNNTSTRTGTTVSEHDATLVSKPSQQLSVEMSPDGATVSKPSPTQTEPASVQIRSPLPSEVNPWMMEEGELNKDRSQMKRPKRNQNDVIDVQGLADSVIDAREGWAASAQEAESKENSTIASNEKKIIALTQEELVRRAFVGPTAKEVDEEFAREKAAVAEEEDDPTRKQKKEKDMSAVSGWGCWTGEGAPQPSPPRKFPKKLQPPVVKKPAKRKRQDEHKPHVIISEKRIKRTADNFMVAQIPYPFTSREEYERAMSGGVGREWNVTSSFKDMTRSEILTRAGKMIKPLSKRAKQPRPAAKF